MNVSRKCQYALRAVFELSRRHLQGPLRTAEIAEAQAVPPRFLELILGELKRGGFVDSRRGARGGYLLVGQPDQVTVGQIIRFVDGPVGPVRCVEGADPPECPLSGGCAFMDMWRRAHDAVSRVFDGTTFQDLVDGSPRAMGRGAADYCI